MELHKKKVNNTVLKYETAEKKDIKEAAAKKTEGDKAEKASMKTAEINATQGAAAKRNATMRAAAEEEAASKKVAPENPSNGTVETRTVNKATTNKAVVNKATEIRHVKTATDKEDYAMKAVEDEAPHITNVGGAWGDLSPDKPNKDLQDRQREKGPYKTPPSEKQVQDKLPRDCYNPPHRCTTPDHQNILSTCPAHMMASTSLKESLPASSAHSTKHNKFDGSARVNLHKVTSQAVPLEPHRSVPDPVTYADQVRLHMDNLKVDRVRGLPLEAPCQALHEAEHQQCPH